MSFLFSNRKKRLIYVKVTTMDADLDAIPIEADCFGQDLFDMVCRIIGVREVWYFGLQHTNKKGFPCWLQLDKKILQQGVVRQSDGSYFFLFLVKFYPEVVEEELIQDVTRHLFFLQIKQSILMMDLYCQPEAAVLLASFAVQATYGDATDDIELQLDKLLPQSVIDQFEMTSDMWKDRIRSWWTNNSGMSIEEAEMEYLRVAQDLSMYGIQYFPIYNQKDTDLLLGITAQGLGIYETSNRMSPRAFFSWITDKSKIKFRAQETSVNQSILDLCIGTHNLYLRRRQTDTLEIQQMKAQAQEVRQKRVQENLRWQREKDQRQQLEQERDRLKDEVDMMHMKLTALENMMQSKDEANKLITEKAKISEEEVFHLSKRANQAEAEVERIKMSQIEAEETKITLERKVRDAEVLAHRLIQESRRSYASHMGLNNDELLMPFWKYAMQNLHHHQSHNGLLLSNHNISVDGALSPRGEDAAEGEDPPAKYFIPNGVPAYFESNGGQPIFPGPYSSQYFNAEIEKLRNQMSKSSDEYRKRNMDFRDRLAEFRREIKALKIEDRQSANDHIHETHVQNGWDRYSTLRKSLSSSSSARAKVIEGL